MRENDKVVTRFAPSPTGFMHVGGVRTAIFAYLWAKKNNGTFILRIEDTDKEREVSGSIEHIIESLNWLKVSYDEGSDKGGPFAPYIQSERLDLYKKYANILIEKGYAYPDPYTEEEVKIWRLEAEENKKPFLYREHRPENFETWDGSKPLRFKVPEIKRYEWQDVVFDKLSAGEEALDDFILIKSDGYPTYNFAHIVDDIEMGVTHVMRGQEFISSTPKFLSLYEALGVKPPIFVTLPPILGDLGTKKLSKRDGAKDILEYREEGYLPEAMFNFLSFLGWNPGGEKEVYTIEELIEVFDITKIQKSGAKWNDEKLDWTNREHMKRLPQEEIEENILALLPENLKNKKIVPLIFDRISKWNDVSKMVGEGELDFFIKLPEYQKENLIYKNSNKETTDNNIKSAIEILENISESDFNLENIKNKIMEKADELDNRGQILHPIRFALSGLPKSPDPFSIIYILGKNESIQRLQKAIQD
jgi:glutamyl-tRNA synthetase